MLTKLRQTIVGKSASAKRGERSLRIEGRKMPYLEITHADEPKSPLLIGVHGFGASEQQMQTLVNIDLDFPHTYIAPRALQKHPTGGYMWFPIGIDENGAVFDEKQVERTLDRLDAFIAAAIERYQADPQRVIFVGYSQGGMLAFRYLLRHPQRVMGAVALAGSISADTPKTASTDAFDGMGLFIGYGTKDTFVSEAEMQQAVAYFRALDVDVTCRSYAIAHVVSQREVADVEQWLTMYLGQNQS